MAVSSVHVMDVRASASVVSFARTVSELAWRLNVLDDAATRIVTAASGWKLLGLGW